MNIEEIEFLRESNAIEGEFSKTALEDAMGAWEYLKINRYSISLAVVLKLHHLLMRRLNPKIAGKWRVNIPVYVGARYCPAESKYYIRKKVDDWLSTCKNHTGLGPEEDIKRWHVAFMEICPFAKGNQQIARILMNIQRINVNLPILIISHEKKNTAD